MRYQSKKRNLFASEIIALSGLDDSVLDDIPPLRDGYYRVSNDSIGGNAPKDFIRVYEYGRAFRSNPQNWPAFVAKVGHKWYPNESITEHFLTRLGQALGFQMADSRLMMAHGQLRLLSRFFLRRRAGNTLVHGAEIFAGYLARKSGKNATNEMEFVKEVEGEDLSRSLFTFQFVESAVRSEFPDVAKEILQDFVKLIAFDALVGNNDRHYFNWGVIGDIRGKRKPQLAPIYDTARALFWNTTDERLKARAEDPARQRQIFLQKYVNHSYPKTGWDGIEKPTHFEVIHNLSQLADYNGLLKKCCEKNPATDAANLMASSKFQTLFCETRKKFVVDCLSLRFEQFKQSIGC